MSERTATGPGAAGHPGHARRGRRLPPRRRAGAAERAALDHGLTVRRGQGHTLRVSATPSVHRGSLFQPHIEDA